MDSKTTQFLLHLSPGDPEPIRKQIARQLRERIVRGELAAGGALPGYRRLARQHRVAPSAVEAAYMLLLEEGILVGNDDGEVRIATLDEERRRQLVEGLRLDELVEQELSRREMKMARDVQRRLLPPTEINGPGWQVAARCVPARVVAGDFYDVLRHPNGRVDVVIADVAGKGFAASLIMASVKAMLPFVIAEVSVAQALRDLNRRLAPEFQRGEFVALTLARYDPIEGSLEISNAGAPDPYLVRPGSEPQLVNVPGPRLPLGIRSEVHYASQTTQIEEGQALLLMTDGMPEAQDGSGDPLGYDALEALLAQQGPIESPASWLAEVFEQVKERTQSLPDDDWTAAMLVPCGAVP
ncbi:MAG: SpoIIE family protein phosphatase [Thermoanaerobaculia bacterium]|nr:SpoIIE family protein phosphatase [Thermoanaerobaculia bacterium]